MTRRACAILLVVSLLLPGCAGMTDRQQTVAGGTGVGAAVGGILGYIVGDTTGAVVGAVVGGAAGALAGHIIAKRKAEYASREDFLAAEINRLAEYNETARIYNEQLREDIARLSDEAEVLRAEYSQEEAKQVVLAEKRAELEERLQRNAALEQDLAKELQVQTAVLEEERKDAAEDDPYIAELEIEVLELQANIELLREGSVQLAGIDERLSI